MAVPAPATPLGRIARYSDIAMALAVIVIVGMLIVPLPDWLLDFCIAANLTAAVVIVLVTLYNTEPLQFSIFPALLLITTLYRLALNIAATKLILATGEPGQVIKAFGQVVLGGNFVVGVISFLILVVIQFVVITNGAGRVAEVAARFTLDAMPGKQMSIDADLNAGLLTEQEARARRKQIEAEADFYGAMDGASKFVRGDAIAAVLIIIINIVGGFVMGMIKGESDALTILQTYTLLTVGEGLVSQIPALLISTATGLMVTRAATDSNMGQDFAAQILRQPRPLLLASALLLGLLLVPGFPKVPLLVVGGTVAMAAWLLLRDQKREERAEDAKQRATASAAERASEEPMQLLSVDTLLLELGSNLVPLALAGEGGDLAARVGQARRKIALELGIVLPMVRIRDDLQLPANRYVIKIRDQVVAQSEAMANLSLAIDPGGALRVIEGIRTTEPAFGGPAVWITRAHRDEAAMAGYIVTDPSSVIITHLTEIIKQHAHELLTRQEAQALIDNLKEHNRAVVDELLPNLMSLGEVQKVLQNLLRERVSIRDLGTILETLADWAPRTKDADQLTEYARAGLARQICKQHCDDEGVLHVFTLAPSLEQTIREGVQMTAGGLSLALEPRLASAVVSGASAQAERASEQGYGPVLLCSSQVRLAMRRLTERSVPSLAVLAYSEIVANTDIRGIGTVEIGTADRAEVAA
ncbi:MAG: flagellar biosynthesis protein FlhA [Chthonomonadales bacterium]|nr:flagellar biosynthesis protein FlhA [Chthonomonadales bacterium]